VVGGGPSLRTFDWNLIKGKRTIGCNSAFILGSDIIEVLCFADVGWWNNIGRPRLEEFGGIIVGCPPLVRDCKFPPWVLWMERTNVEGLTTELGSLCFNGNTGALAINLALALGSREIYLLGFDMKGTKEQWNWHDVRHEQPHPVVIPLHIGGLGNIARDLPKKFPGAKVINITDDSAVDCFPKQKIKDHFNSNLGKGVPV
jgi:hypothetical protein